MKKHLFLCLISLSLILCFAACDNSKKNETKETTPAAGNTTAKTTETEPKTGTTTKATAVNTTTSSSITTKTEQKQPVTETVDRQIIDRTDAHVQKALAAYKAVLLDDAEFFCTTPGYPEFPQGMTTLSRQLDVEMPHSDDPTIALKEFAIIDLDNDAVPEVILPLIPSSYTNNNYILHYDAKDDLVYAYCVSPRALPEVKIDGTFSAHVNGPLFEGKYAIYVITSFDGETYSTEEVSTWSADSVSFPDVTIYCVNSKRVTEEEYRAAQDYQDNKREVTWYDYTEENIKAYFSPQ